MRKLLQQPAPFAGLGLVDVPRWRVVDLALLPGNSIAVFPLKLFAVTTMNTA
jgi:hypothetical protein